MLAGLPCAGKSTFVKKFLDEEPEHYGILSSDNIIDVLAAANHITHDEAFRKYDFKEIMRIFNITLKSFIEKDSNIIWDQTNCTLKTRRKKLRRIPDHYHKTLYFFQTPLEECLKRNTREGKIIPQHVMENMNEHLVLTDEDYEIFDEIIMM